MTNIALLKTWINQQIPDLPELNFEPLNGDAGFRQYFRFYHGLCPLIAVYAPPNTEKNQEFVKVAEALKKANVLVPEVFAYDLEQGFLLLSDLGNQTLLSQLNPVNMQSLYQEAMQQIARMQSIDAPLPLYDEKTLALELSYFQEWFLKALLAYALNQKEQQIVDDFFNQLMASATEQPQKFVHRDYHSRNIMYQADGDLACIDFQDALIGPVTYDLVSLLRDCYIVWPEEQVQQLLYFFWQKYYSEIEQAQFQRWFDLMGLQRHIKVLGIFARLALRDNKHAYLNDLPRVIHYVLTVSEKHKAAREFTEWFKQKLMPLIVQQPWWKASDK